MDTKIKNNEYNVAINPARDSDQSLLAKLKSAVRLERQTTQEILQLLKEVDRRQLHLKWGYSSLFTFLTQGLGYSEGSAQRRVLAMRLLKSLGSELSKKVESDLTSGSLSLSSACSAQSVFQKDKTFSTPESKVEVLEALKGKSRVDVQRHLIQKSPVAAAIAFGSKTVLPTTQNPGLPLHVNVAPASWEKKKVITAELTELRLYVDQDTLEQLNQLQLLLSHQLEDPRSYSELLKKLTSMALKKMEPKSKVVPALTPHNSAEQPTLKQESLRSPVVPLTATKSSEISSSMNSKIKENSATTKQRSPAARQEPTRYIPAAIRRAVLARDNYCCSYADPLTGRTCGSMFKLEFDHAIPFALEPGLQMYNVVYSNFLGNAP